METNILFLYLVAWEEKESVILKWMNLDPQGQEINATTLISVIHWEYKKMEKLSAQPNLSTLLNVRLYHRNERHTPSHHSHLIKQTHTHTHPLHRSHLIKQSHSHTHPLQRSNLIKQTHKHTHPLNHDCFKGITHVLVQCVDSPFSP